MLIKTPFPSGGYDDDYAQKIQDWCDNRAEQYKIGLHYFLYSEMCYLWNLECSQEDLVFFTLCWQVLIEEK